MRFNVAFQDVEEGQVAGGRIQNSGRVYPCAVCGHLTRWRDISDLTSPPAPICSDECLDIFDGTGTTPTIAVVSTFAKVEERVMVEVVNPDAGTSTIPLDSFLA